MNPLVFLCICFIAVPSFVYSRPPSSLQIEKQTIIELPPELVNGDHVANNIDIMNELLKNFSITEQRNILNNTDEIPIKSATEVSEIPLQKMSDTKFKSSSDVDMIKAREGAVDLNEQDLDANTKNPTFEHMILISPLISRLLNDQNQKPQQMYVNTGMQPEQVNHIQDHMKHMNMDNTVYNIHYLVRNKLSQLHDGNSNKIKVKQNKVNSNRRWKVPLMHYTPFVTEYEILDVPSDFISIEDLDPKENICCNWRRPDSLQNYAFDRISRNMKTNSNVILTEVAVNANNDKLDAASKRLNDKYASDMDDVDDAESDIVIENLALNGPVANYRADSDAGVGLFKYPGDKKYELPEFRIGNPFERTTTPLPIMNNDGIYINKLKIRKGGVAIAGPNGVATAGSGGTAIVGPGGIAYAKPDGLAVAGPGARVISVPSTTNLREFFLNIGNISQGRSSSHDFPIPEGAKLVAFGPIIYYNKGHDV